MLKKNLVIVHSYHHNNTARIAEVLAEVLNADLKTANEVVIENLKNYELIGFGSGIDSGKHYKPLLDLVDRLLEVENKEAFIFSTSAVQWKNKVKKDHSTLRDKLQEKGYKIIGEFSCKGFNTNSFLKHLGGMNKGRPNSDDLLNVQQFALSLIK